MNDLQNEVGALGQIFAEENLTGDGLSIDLILEFEAKLDDVRQELRDLLALAGSSDRSLLQELEETFDELASSWLVVYRHFGVDQATAITEQVVTAEPLSEKLRTQILPRLAELERADMEAARVRYYEVSQLTGTLALVGVAISVLVAFLVAYNISRHLVRGFEELKLGAEHIGAGQLEERIVVRGHDELSELADAFNEMSENLMGAQHKLTRANAELEKRNEEVEEQRQVSESLLRNILPKQVAAELQSRGEVAPSYFEDVTVLFADIKGFTLSTESLAAEELVQLLNNYFTAFDEITLSYRLEKLKTIGDCYMLVAGCPRRHASHAVDAVLAAFEMLHAVEARDRPDSLVDWQVRIGIHTGPVIAGVVGTQKFAFDIWGDTVNQASRMESAGEAGRINLSYRTYSRVKDFIACESRGKILTKEKRAVEMYFANGILPELLDDTGDKPPQAFKRRYRVYFHDDPPSFPGFDPNLRAAEKAAFLGRVSLFSSLDSLALRRIADVAEEVSFPAGASIFAAGDPGDCGYIVEKGKVRIHRGDEELTTLPAPSYFGEMSLLSDRPRAASATAESDCQLLSVSRDEFRKILLIYPQAGLDVIRVLSGYLADAGRPQRR